MPRLNHARGHGNRPSDNLHAQLTRNIVKWNYNMPITPIASSLRRERPLGGDGHEAAAGSEKRDDFPLLGGKEMDAGGDVHHIAAVDVNRALDFSSP